MELSLSFYQPRGVGGVGGGGGKGSQKPPVCLPGSFPRLSVVCVRSGGHPEPLKDPEDFKPRYLLLTHNKTFYFGLLQVEENRDECGMLSASVC